MMHHFSHHARRRGFLLLVAVISLMLRGGFLHAQGSVSGDAVLSIGRFNPDTYPDTVIGTKTPAGYLPSRVLWGYPFGQTPGAMPGKLRETVLRYPAWKDLRGSVAFQRINADSLVDMVLHLQGVVTTMQGEGLDSLRSVVVFGQSGLDSLAVVDLDGIRRFQVRPFFAVELVREVELSEPGTRDLSGSMSYVLEPIELDVQGKPSPLPRTVASVEGSGGVLRLYPNPAGKSLRIEAGGLASGAYTVQLVSVAGAVVVREEIIIAAGESILHTLDVQHIASGYYVVRIERGEEVVGSYPIIITR